MNNKDMLDDRTEHCRTPLLTDSLEQCNDICSNRITTKTIPDEDVQIWIEKPYKGSGKIKELCQSIKSLSYV